MTFLSTSSGQSVDLSNHVALLEALDEFQANLGALRENGLTGHNARENLAVVLRTPSNPAVVAAFNAVNLGGLLDKLKPLGALAKVVEGPAGGLLLERLSSLASGDAAAPALDWQIIDGNTGAMFAGVGLKLDGALRIGFAADASRDLWQYSDAPGEFLLRTSIAGKIHATAGYTLPFSAGKLSAAGKAGGDVTAAWFHDPVDADRGATLATLFAKRLPSLPNPFDLQAVSRAFDVTDLVGLQLHPKASTQISLELAIGVDSEIAKGIKLAAGATVQATAQLETGFELSLAKRRPRPAGGTHEIDINISRQRLSGRELGLAFAVELDMSGLTRRTREIISGKIGLFREELAIIRPYLSPGTYAKQLLKAELERVVSTIAANDAFVSALNADLSAAIDRQDVSGVNAWVESQMSALLDRAFTLGTGTAQQAARQALESAPAFLASILGKPGVKMLFETGLKDLVTASREALRGQMKGLAKPALTALNNTLENAGASVSSAADAADLAVKRIAELADKIDRLASRIAAEMESPLRSRISMKLAASERRWDGRGLELSGRFTAINADTAHLYRQLVNGRWDNVLDAFRNGAPGFILDADSRITQSSGRERKSVFHLVAFGFGAEIGGHNIFSAEVVVDGHGNVEILTKGERTRRAGFLGQTKSLAVNHSIAMALGGASALKDTPALSNATFSVMAQYEDRKLRRHEVQDFADRFAVFAETDATIEPALLDGIFGKAAGSHVNGLVRASLDLPIANATRLIAIGLGCEPGTHQRSEAFAVARDALATLYSVDDAVRDLLGIIHGRMKTHYATPISADVAWLNFLVWRKITTPRQFGKWFDDLAGWPIGGGDFATAPGSRNRIRRDKMRRAGLLLTLCALFPEVLRALAAAASALSKPDLSPDERIAAANVAQARFAEKLREFTGLGDNLEELFSEGPSRRFLLFLLPLVALLEKAGEGYDKRPPLDVMLALAGPPGTATLLLAV